MAEDLKNIRLSSKASEIADKILLSELFEDRIMIYKFAFSYAIKNYFSEIRPEELDAQFDSAGSNYNVGSIDDDKFLSQLVCSLYPNTTTPYRYIRAIICFGLIKLGELLDAGQLYPISQWM